MDAYIFQAALLCEDCAQHVREGLHAELLALADQDGNSDMAPQGPYADGGGEADMPQHCDHCGTFLQNPLTSEGYDYVRDMASDKTSHCSVVNEWVAFYEIDEE